MNLSENQNDDLHFNWDYEECIFIKNSMDKPEEVNKLDSYLDFLEQIGPLKPDRIPSKIYPVKFAL